MRVSSAFVYAVVSILPGLTILIFMLLSFFEFRNRFLGYFLLGYVGAGLLSVVYLMDVVVASVRRFWMMDWIELVELVGVVLLIEGLTWLVGTIFYEDVSVVMRVGMFVLGAVPVVLFGVMRMGDVDEQLVYAVYYLYLYVVLAVDCLVFILNFRKILNSLNQRLGLGFAVLLFVFILLFVGERFVDAINILFNPMPAFFLMWTLFLIGYAWQVILKPGMRKLFEVQNDFAAKYQLSAREEEIVALILEGKKNATIAAQLVISEKTVTNHVYNIYKKLAISSRFELICLYKD